MYYNTILLYILAMKYMTRGILLFQLCSIFTSDVNCVQSDYYYIWRCFEWRISLITIHIKYVIVFLQVLLLTSHYNSLLPHVTISKHNISLYSSISYWKEDVFNNTNLIIIIFLTNRQSNKLYLSRTSGESVNYYRNILKIQTLMVFI